MGNREDLLAGAIRCLQDKGWARTTVRDIGAAAGVSHAAIGYHFGSREALLMQALVQALDEWGSRVEPAHQEESDDPLVASWSAMVRSFTTERPMWRASIDAMVQAEHHPPLGELLAVAQEEGRRGAAAGLLGVAESTLHPETVRTLGSVQSALISGVLMQWLVDPDTAPSGAEVAAGLRELAALIDG